MGMKYARLYFDFIDGDKAEFVLDTFGNIPINPNQLGHYALICLQRLWCIAGVKDNEGTFNMSAYRLEKAAKWKCYCPKCEKILKLPSWKDEDCISGKFVEILSNNDFPLIDVLEKNKKYYLHNFLKNNPHLSESAKKMRTDRATAGGQASSKKKDEPKKKED